MKASHTVMPIGTMLIICAGFALLALFSWLFDMTMNPPEPMGDPIKCSPTIVLSHKGTIDFDRSSAVCADGTATKNLSSVFNRSEQTAMDILYLAGHPIPMVVQKTHQRKHHSDVEWKLFSE